MVITNNNGKTLLVNEFIKVDVDKQLINNKFHFHFAKDNHDILVVGRETYNNIIKEISNG